MSIKYKKSALSGKNRFSWTAIKTILVFLAVAPGTGWCSETGGTIAFHGMIYAPTCSASVASGGQNTLQVSTSCSGQNQEKVIAVAVAYDVATIVPAALSPIDHSILSNNAPIDGSKAHSPFPIAGHTRKPIAPGVRLSFEPLASEEKPGSGILTVHYE